MFPDSQVAKCGSLTISHYTFSILSGSEVFIFCSLNTQWQLQKCEMSHGQVCVVPKRLFISLSVISLKGKMLKTLPYCLNQQNISHSSPSPFLLWLRGACKHNKIVVSSEWEIWQQTQNLNSNCKFFQNVSLYQPCHEKLSENLKCKEQPLKLSEASSLLVSSRFCLFCQKRNVMFHCYNDWVPHNSTPLCIFEVSVFYLVMNHNMKQIYNIVSMDSLLKLFDSLFFYLI